MNVSTMPIRAATPASVSPQLATPDKISGRGAKAAREFEAQLIGSLLESLEKTFAAVPSDDTVPGSDDYNYLGTHALAQALADRGGFGIAAMITQHLPSPKPSLQQTSPPENAHTKVREWQVTLDSSPPSRDP
jgi:Rod binding domain-containing protein